MSSLTVLKIAFRTIYDIVENGPVSCQLVLGRILAVIIMSPDNFKQTIMNNVAAGQS